MWLRKAVIAVLCVVSIVGQPAILVARACCCTQPTQKRSLCCHHAPSAAQPVRHSCCAKSARKPRSFDWVCGCFVKTPPPVTSKSLEFKAPHEVQGGFWPAALPALGEMASRGLHPLESAANPASGPPLLAILCRWRN